MLDVLKLKSEMASHGIDFGWIVRQGDNLKWSHEVLKPVAAKIEELAAFNGHEAVFVGQEPGKDVPFFAFVHSTTRGLSQGGLRFRNYRTLEALLIDGLNLSRGMTLKNSLVEIWWGGGKGIIPLPPGLKKADDLQGAARDDLFRAYGRFVRKIKGVYYTAEDMGTKTTDMVSIQTQTKFVTCLPKDKGGSGNPSPYTAEGVFNALRAGWKHLTGSDDLTGVHVALQGIGNCGYVLAKHLLKAGAILTVSDKNMKAIENLKADYPAVKSVHVDDILGVEADIFAPCAGGLILNATTIENLKVKMVCGAANNQLEDEVEDAERLHRRGILYIPDFHANRTGIVNCCDEPNGYLPEKVKDTVKKMYRDTEKILAKAVEDGVNPYTAAVTKAKELAQEVHKTYPGRGQALIQLIMKGDGTD